MRVAIASGKGGTGKTTVATNLALSVGGLDLLDCDVEEPDSHIFLDVELEVIEEVSIKMPVIDREKCTLCGKCAAFCQYQAIAVLPKDILFFPELCHGCGGCTLVCPEKAITEEDHVIGVVEGGPADGITFHRGLLNVGEPMAIPVIRALKRRLDDDRDAILDAPPGTACPMIETLHGCDHVILVTEPTPFGLYDLRIAVDVSKKIGIPFSVIINRDGIGNDCVETYCDEEGIPILMRIPHDRRIAELYSVGRPFSLEMPEWKERFRTMFEGLKDGLKDPGRNAP